MFHYSIFIALYTIMQSIHVKPPLKAESVGNFEAGHRLRLRNILSVCEQLEIKPDAKITTLYAFSCSTAGLHKVLLDKAVQIAIHNRLNIRSLEARAVILYTAVIEDI